MATLLSARRAGWRDYLELTKPKVVVLMLRPWSTMWWTGASTP